MVDRFGTLASIVVACLLFACSAGAAESGTASIPLQELLELYRAREQTKPDAPPPPPIAATVSRLELTGRLLEDAVDLKARVELALLANEWQVIPLLGLDAETVVSELPSIAGGVVTVRDNQLVFVGNTAGTYRFDLGVMQRAESRDGTRHVELRPRTATLSILRLAYDESLFELTVPIAGRDNGAAVLYPTGDTLPLTWRTVAAPLPTPQVEEKRPPAPNGITTARASVVSTLQGRRITRILYDLQFEGRQQLPIELPPDQHLDAVYQNGQSVPFAAEGSRVVLDITPAHAGGEPRVIEMVLSGGLDEYLLSGRLEVTLPMVGWPINELTCTLSLPDVFNYTSAGGSLSPADDVPAVDFTRRIPSPGKTLAYRQYLIDGSAPSASVDYSVNLAGQYFGR